ncbi:MAG: SGNH/GDSL hydrolase family protein [Thermoanaerobaculia bacterium]
MRTLLIVAIALASLGGPAAADAPLRVLFIGNSLTYTNDLPRMVEAFSTAGQRHIRTTMIAGPNYGLEDLWNDAKVREAIGSKQFDVVVMQQGPSALPASRAELVKWSKTLAAAIREAGAEPALYMVWPSLERASDRPRVSESYRIAAKDCGCRLLPAGDAWQVAWKKSGRLSLYGTDGFHPSREGSWLAALVIWSALTGEDPERAPSEISMRDGSVVRIGAKVKPLLVDAAREATR